ncbi:MAG: hypothetical protein ABIK43_03770 [candidate division WOR-3 bacterium]
MARSRRWVAWILFCIWVIGTFVALNLPLGTQPQLIRRGLDKSIHTGLFVVMGVLGQAAAPWAHLLFTGPYAFGVEWLQRKLPFKREYSTVDLASNLLGLALGVICCELAAKLR